MKKKFYKCLSVALACAMLLAFLPAFTALAEQTPGIVDSGACGPNAVWTLDSENTLRISGTGEIYSQAFFRGFPNVKTLIIEEGITSVGYLAFGCCNALETVSLPESLTEIAAWGFGDCPSITAVELPSGITRIEDYTFANCQKMVSVTIPEGVTYIGVRAFQENYKLTDVHIPAAVTYIGEGAFCHCLSLTEIEIPEGVEAVAPNTFRDCYALKKITLPHSITSIGERAFGYDFALDDLYYNGVRADWEQIELADDLYSEETTHRPIVHFTDGDHLCAAGNPESENYVYATCSETGSYEEVYYCRACHAELSRTVETINMSRHTWGRWTVTAAPTAAAEGEMERRCYRDASHVETAVIPAGVMGDNVYARGYCGLAEENDGKNVQWELTYDGALTITGTGAMRDYDWGEAPWLNETGIETALFHSQGINIDENDGRSVYLAMADGVFTREMVAAAIEEIYHPVLSITVGEGVTAVGDRAFVGCSEATQASLPSTLERIGYGAFQSCSGITELSLPEGLRELGDYAISYTGLERIVLPASLEILGYYAVSGNCLYSVTVLNPALGYNELQYIALVGTSGEDYPFESIADYKLYKEAYDLRQSYAEVSMIEQFLQDPDSVYAQEDIESIMTELGMTEEEAQRMLAGMYNFMVDYYLAEYEAFYGMALSSAADIMAVFCEEMNGLLGVSAPAEDLFCTNDAEGCLAPVADTLLTYLTGVQMHTLQSYYSSCVTFSMLSYWESDYRLAPFDEIILPCDSAVPGDPNSSRMPIKVMHTLENAETVLEPTCAAPGERTGVCAVCGETVTEEIPTLPHTPGTTAEDVWMIETACTQSGLKDEATRCAVCGEICSESFSVIPAQGHIYQSEIISAPTCTEAGETAYLCTVCGDTYTETEPALGHGTLGYDVSGAPSTCTVRGYSMTVCIACGEITDYQEYELDPTNHNWGEWTLVTPATYLTEGLEQRTCGWCGDTETRPIPALEPEITIGDPDTGIELQLQQGVLPENTVFTVDEEFDGTYFRLLNREVGNVSSTLYNITPVADGVNVQPDGYVLVRLPIPAGYNPDTLSIYYISTETGTTERMNCYVEDGYICFQTTHFSVYAIVDASSPAEAPTETPTNNGGASLSFFARIAAFFQRIAEFFRTLFRR